VSIELVPMRWWHIEDLLPIEAELFGAEEWSPEMFWSELAEYDTRHYLIAVEGTQILGYAGLCVYGDEGYVQNMAVRRAWQGQGLGKRLLRALLAESERRGTRLTGLEVRADNVAAQRLYAAHGFEPVGLRRGYYQPSNTDAVVMIRER
jgi:ribosomal-protein-alanine N-acetyltransferase